MNGSYLPPAHAAFYEVSRRFQEIEHGGGDASQIGSCLQHLVQVTDGFYPPDQIICLQQLYHQTLCRLYYGGRLNDAWAIQIELDVVSRCIGLCAQKKAMMDRQALAYMHERYAYLAFITGCDTYHNIEQHQAYALELRYPRRQQLKRFGFELLKFAALYWSARSRQKR